MAKSKSNKGGGFSLSPAAQVVGTGLFGAGPATATEHIFGMFDYQGKRKAVPALLVTYERDDEKPHIESYTVGNGWKVSGDGKTLIPRAGQTGLNDNCKAAKYIAALRDECGMPEDFVSDDITVLDGIEGTLDRKPLEKVEGSDKAGSILIFTDVDTTPWENGAGQKLKTAVGKARAKAKEEDEDEDDDDDEAPKKKSAKGRAAADDEDEDENTTADDDTDEDLDELATEALIEALDDGPLKVAKVEGAVLAAPSIKKNKERKAIAARAAEPKFLETEKGWDFNGKIVSLTD